ncbi:phage tail tape measure protein [Pseudochrobactrum sp. sp1633]|uniref:phage tail tape measure protein n=1 Tax=Pseudochrobactrum sp. sp1633 TaxID=3036706 RepID=UPI0025A4CD47|nr:phage tail tape measure protein [Pseudochrobactrum sp. sp1633]MDM8345168.1 phage tail tape measure protein [Pseudochrobactrum sp. sp1633]HWD12981.1 phage tail tape measure protein [Pseudochrobactrum sp.]
MIETGTEQQTVMVAVEADTSGFDRALDNLQKRSGSFGQSLTSAFKSAVTSGKGLDDVLRGLAGNMASMALDAGMKPLQGLFSSMFSGVMGGLKGLGGVTPFAKGGVVSSPTYFGLGSGFGVAGEAGAEAILPLTRGSDGSLGVATGGGGGRSMQVNFYMSSPDAASFSRSEAQVSAMLARAVRHGTRQM